MLLGETVKVKVVGSKGNDYFYEKDGKLKGIHTHYDLSFNKCYSGANTDFNLDELNQKSNDEIEVEFVERFEGAGPLRMDMTIQSMEKIINANYFKYTSKFRVDGDKFQEYEWSDVDTLLKFNHRIIVGNMEIKETYPGYKVIMEVDGAKYERRFQYNEFYSFDHIVGGIVFNPIEDLVK